LTSHAHEERKLFGRSAGHHYNVYILYEYIYKRLPGQGIHYYLTKSSTQWI